jgi:hypothetical protein
MEKVCIIAIAKDELPFIDEWLAYHRIIGVDHVFLLDDEEGAPLVNYLAGSDFATVIPWFKHREQTLTQRNQIKAYWHGLKEHAINFEWVCFLDIDEFIVFRRTDNIKTFLSDFNNAGSVSLNWHVFGHNGYFNDPEGLITSSLTRRMFIPSKNVKSITRTKLITDITPHHCKINGLRVDANNKKFTNELYPGKTDVAHVNHYQCRSFTRWMKRAARGDVNFNPDNAPTEQQWRLTTESCLEKFVTTVALDKNEYVDDYMKKFEVLILKELETPLTER